MPSNEFEALNQALSTASWAPAGSTEAGQPA